MPLKLNDQDICTMYSRGLNAPEICAYKYGSNRGVGKEITIYPKEFRAWISSHSHDKSTVSDRHSWRAIRNLCDRGFGEIVTDGFGRIVLVLFSLDFVCGRNSQTETKKPKADPEKPDDSNTAEKSRVKQQQLILTKQICKSAGINYRLEKDWWEIASHGIDKIKATIDKMMIQISRGRTMIYNPPGWLKVALRENYYLDKLITDTPMALIEQAYLWSKQKLLDLAGSLPIEPNEPLQLDLFSQKKYDAQGRLERKESNLGHP